MKGGTPVSRTTKERLAQMDASHKKNEQNIRAFVDEKPYHLGDSDDREWMVEHFEMRLHELRAKGAPASITGAV